jgi:superfamily II RNA helicase
MSIISFVEGYPPTDPAITYTFPLDPFQQQAILSIHRAENVLVTAKTGSGKTLVGEYQIAYSLREGKRVFYTTPIKSLSNQKYHDLKLLFPKASVGIMTGDIKNNPEADIVVMTTEILRNLLFKQTTPTQHLGTAGQLTLNNLGAVVFDEVHYINDPERGHVWEETLILMPPTVRMILLSATIDSPELFADWLRDVKQTPIALLKTTHRVVPLIHGIYDATQKPLPIRQLKEGDEAPFQAPVYSQWIRDREQRAKAADDWSRRVAAGKAAGDSMAGKAGKVKIQSFTHTLNECVNELSVRSLLPALFFVFSRKECERYAEQLTDTLIDPADVASIRHILQFHLHRYNETLQHLPQYHQIVRLLER